MRRNFLCSIHKLFVLILIMFGCISAEQLAFPTAEGPGKYATGGRGGKVYKVTSLKDDYSAGTLRWAINHVGPRTIVFEVSGTIDLTSNLDIGYGDLTIAGQTAPGDGICLKGYSTGIDANNVIIRYLRFRMGDINGNEGDALGGRGIENVIIDHCSFSWSTDETVSLYNNSDITFQWCMVTESLNESVHHKGSHGYGGIWGGGPNHGKAAFHYNLIAHHTSRNPRFAGYSYAGDRDDKFVDFRNNVLYNWGSQSIYGGEAQNQNMVANYYKYGPATGPKDRIVQPSSPIGDWYITDNFVYGFPEITKDNWNGGVQPPKGRVDKPHDIEHAVTHSAENAYKLVLADGGTVLPNRDAVDARIVEEVRTQTATYGDNGIIDSQSEVGGWPELNSTQPPADTDDDGMPDEWENAQGLDPNDASDRNDDQDGDGYTNLEEYLNGLTKRDDYLLSPAGLEGKAISPSEVELTWNENVPFEDGFKLERSEGDTTNYVEVADLEENTTSYSEQGLDPETKYYYRVKAYNQTTSSIYSNVKMVKTLYADGSPLEPTEPSPADSSEEVDILPLLDWEKADGASSYNVYLGTSETPQLVAEDVPESRYQPTQSLEKNTAYYWQVVSKNQNGTTGGKIWKFKTGFYAPYLVGYWTFDFQAGGFTPDSTYLENWGFLAENMTDGNTIPGKAGNALSFNGNDDYMYIEHVPFYQFGAKSFSVSFWVKMDNGEQNAFLLSKGSFPEDEVSQGFAIYSTAEGKLVFHVGDSEEETILETEIDSLATGEWEKLTAIRNREQGELQLFVNSYKLASKEDNSWSINNGSRIYIGSRLASTDFFQGALDNVRLTNYALEESEIGGLNTTDLKDVNKPEKYSLELKNYPNPFNPITSIHYSVPKKQHVSLQVYNIKGELVEVLVDNELKKPGNYSLSFNGASLSSGVYISRLKVGSHCKTKKMMLIK